MQDAQRVENKVDITNLVQEVLATKFDYDAPLKDPEPLLTFWSDSKSYPVGGRGMIGGIIGPEKAGKSFITSNFAVSHLTNGAERLNFELKLDGNMVWFDTEQSQYFYQVTQKRIHDEARISRNVEKYSAYHLRRWTPTERLLAMEDIIYKIPNIQCLVIDGVVDLTQDYNNLKESDEVMNTLMRWSYDLNMMLIGVLHVNKGDGKIRGHLGSSFKNKCDFIIKVEQPKRNEYEISNPTGRYVTFPSLCFSRNEESKYGDAEYLNGKQKHKIL